jgi:hypothetical protein
MIMTLKRRLVMSDDAGDNTMIIEPKQVQAKPMMELTPSSQQKRNQASRTINQQLRLTNSRQLAQ